VRHGNIEDTIARLIYGQWGRREGEREGRTRERRRRVGRDFEKIGRVMPEIKSQRHYRM